MPDGNGARFGLLVADDQHIGNLLQLGLPDLLADLLIAVIGLHPVTGGIQLRGYLVGVCRRPVGDGQELDLKYEALAATEEQLRLIHRNKTGALINAAVQMGAAAAQANETQCKELEDYAFGIGLVFQIVDDVLDVTSTAEQLGKPIGSDSENGKTTFVTLYGAEGAMELAKKLNNETCASLHAEFGEKAAFLEQLAKELLVRRS